MFKRILIANRGEIAVRIFRACRELDIEPVVVYSEADREALHVQLAEHAYCIGPAPSAKSYLDVDAILTVAKATGCDAIHPGYGFLSENADFARRCAAEGIVFIGPSAEVIERMGNKAAARELMKSAGVPVVPGSDGDVPDAKTGAKIAEKIGYPVLIKAAAGGGGRGMRKVFHPEDFETLFEEARAESRACFNDDEMYLEKLVLNPHHIEFQIMADSHGNVVQLGERDCSIQRRGQKMIEETPARVLSPELRARMGEAAVAAARAANYVNAGTIEFVLDPSGEFYFIEMNTRIQVEHPITEIVTATDLVREQIRVGGRALAQLYTGRHSFQRPRYRMPHQRRGPDEELPPGARARGLSAPARWRGRARRHRPLRRLRAAALLRLAHRQAHLLGADASRGHQAHAPRARRDHRGRPRNQRGPAAPDHVPSAVCARGV